MNEERLTKHQLIVFEAIMDFDMRWFDAEELLGTVIRPIKTCKVLCSKGWLERSPDGMYKERVDW